MMRGTFAVVAAVLIAITLVGTGSAYSEDSGFCFDGDGIPHYPNKGYMWAYANNPAGDPGKDGTHTTSYSTNPSDVYYVHVSGTSTASTLDSSQESSGCTWTLISWTQPTGHEYTSISCVDANSISSGGGSYSFPNPTNSVDVTGAACVNVWSGWNSGGSSHVVVHIDVVPIPVYTVSGATACLTSATLYINLSGDYHKINHTALNGSDSYEFEIIDDGKYRLLFSDGAYHDFTCSGSDVVFDYDACIWVYGYTCGIDTIKLRDSNSQLVDTVYQTSRYAPYEMQIVAGEEYTISFYDMGIILCHSQTFTSTGNHVLIDFDRCNWVYQPSPWADPAMIYLWAGYDYNIVVFRDEHGNFIENSQLAIYDKTDNRYIQRWTDDGEGYALLGARFDTDHEVMLSLRTFDGVFTLDTTYPANGSALVGEEDITTTNWTIPIRYNLDIFPVDPSGVPIFDVFCGLSEYTPLNPGAFWGMDLSDRGYVSVTNCSGFSMCDIVAEKDGYTDYNTEALEWTSKSALVKDYRHNIVMEEE